MKYILIALIALSSGCSLLDTAKEVESNVDKQAIKDCIKDEIKKAVDETKGEAESGV